LYADERFDTVKLGRHRAGGAQEQDERRVEILRLLHDNSTLPLLSKY
jgi:hypothetical protein